MISRYAKNAIVLGLLSAVGPFAIDMYLPALPTIAADLNASTAATQMTLTAFFLSFGICQIVYGPVADMVGRKPPLYVGLTLFILGSVGCALSASVGWLIAFRVVQGIGAAAGMVIPRAVIRDLHTGPEAMRLMSLVILVFSVSPILAPVTGSGLILLFGWRAVFVAVTVTAVAGFVMVVFGLPETRSPEQRVGASIGNALIGFGSLLRHKRFLGLTFIGGLGMASFFAFLAASSFVYIERFGLTPTQYSFAFSANAAGFIGSSQFASQLGARFGMVRVVTAAISACAAFTLVLFAITASGTESFPALVVLLFLAFACLGLVIPATMVLALEEHGPIAGMASALGGTLQMVTGGVMIVILSLFFNGTALPMVTAIALCATGAFALTLITLHRGAVLAQAAE